MDETYLHGYCGEEKWMKLTFMNIVKGNKWMKVIFMDIVKGDEKRSMDIVCECEIIELLAEISLFVMIHTYILCLVKSYIIKWCTSYFVEADVSVLCDNVKILCISIIVIALWTLVAFHIPKTKAYLITQIVCMIHKPILLVLHVSM